MRLLTFIPRHCLNTVGSTLGAYTSYVFYGTENAWIFLSSAIFSTGFGQLSIYYLVILFNYLAPLTLIGWMLTASIGFFIITVFMYPTLYHGLNNRLIILWQCAKDLDCSEKLLYLGLRLLWKPNLVLNGIWLVLLSYIPL
jgi:hypothetical protein